MDRLPRIINRGFRNRFRFAIGRSRTGRWIVVDSLGLAGGLFVDRGAALRFAKTESACDNNEMRPFVEVEQLELGDLFTAGKSARDWFQ